MGTNRNVVDREKCHYDCFSNRTPPIAERLQTRHVCDRHFMEVPRGMYEGKVVLDACCGEARYTIFMAQEGALQEVGLDSSLAHMHSTLSIAPRRMYDQWIRSAGVPQNCQLLQGDAADLSAFAAETIDTVCIFQALHHLPEPRRFLAEAHRVLRRGGHLVVSDPNGRHPLRKLATAIGRTVGFLSEDEAAYCMDEVKCFLITAGFVLERACALNLFSELNYLLATVLSLRWGGVGDLILAGNLLLRPLDNWMERAVFPRIPTLGWRFLIIAHKEIR